MLHGKVTLKPDGRQQQGASLFDIHFAQISYMQNLLLDQPNGRLQDVLYVALLHGDAASHATALCTQRRFAHTTPLRTPRRPRANILGQFWLNKLARQAKDQFIRPMLA